MFGWNEKNQRTAKLPENSETRSNNKLQYLTMRMTVRLKKNKKDA